MKLRLFGIIVEIKYSFIILLILNIISKTFRNYNHYYFACYLFILFHEFSHIFVASLFNCRLKKIEFSLCGMSANIMLNKNKLKNILIFLAGPLANIILFLIFHENGFISKINIVLGIINLLPIFPLDGYRILKELKVKTNKLEYILYIIIVLLGIILKNFSMIIFIVYIIILKINNRQTDGFQC